MSEIDENSELVGYEAAAAYLGLKKNTLTNYASAGRGPYPVRTVQDRQYLRPVFTKGRLDEWKANRPGRGAGGGRKPKSK